MCFRTWNCFDMRKQSLKNIIEITFRANIYCLTDSVNNEICKATLYFKISIHRNRILFVFFRCWENTVFCLLFHYYLLLCITWNYSKFYWIVANQNDSNIESNSMQYQQITSFFRSILLFRNNWLWVSLLFCQSLLTFFRWTFTSFSFVCFLLLFCLWYWESTLDIVAILYCRTLKFS